MNSVDDWIKRRHFPSNLRVRSDTAEWIAQFWRLILDSTDESACIVFYTVEHAEISWQKRLVRIGTWSKHALKLMYVIYKVRFKYEEDTTLIF